jgi:hypothetical protein
MAELKRSIAKNGARSSTVTPSRVASAARDFIAHSEIAGYG